MHTSRSWQEALPNEALTYKQLSPQAVESSRARSSEADPSKLTSTAKRRRRHEALNMARFWGLSAHLLAVEVIESLHEVRGVSSPAEPSGSSCGNRFSSSSSFRKGVRLLYCPLRGVGMPSGVVTAFLPAPVWDNQDLNRPFLP